jgi:hypothetical protein
MTTAIHQRANRENNGYQVGWPLSFERGSTDGTVIPSVDISINVTGIPWRHLLVVHDNGFFLRVRFIQLHAVPLDVTTKFTALYVSTQTGSPNVFTDSASEELLVYGYVAAVSSLCLYRGDCEVCYLSYNRDSSVGIVNGYGLDD